MKRIIKELSEVIRKEAPVAVPAARDAAVHGEGIREDLLEEVHGEPQETLNALLLSDSVVDVWLTGEPVVRYL